MTFGQSPLWACINSPKSLILAPGWLSHVRGEEKGGEDRGGQRQRGKGRSGEATRGAERGGEEGGGEERRK